MGISKVEYDNEILMDVSNDTITAENLAKGLTAHNSNGDQITGTFPIGEVGTQAALISQIKSTLVGKTAGGGGTGGEEVSDLFIATCDVDMSTMTMSNLSHLSEEMKNAHNSGKAVKLMCNIQLSGTSTTFIANLVSVVDTANTIMFNGLFHDGVNLMYFQIIVMGTGSMITPFVIPTVAASEVSLNE